jgi:hypothetical protein
MGTHGYSARTINSFIVGIALVFANAGLVVAGEPADSPSESQPPPPTGAALDRLIAIYGNEPVIEHELGFSAQVVTHNHWVKALGDEEWRDYYGTTWDDKINNAIERADDAMYTEFGIDFRVNTIQQWDTSPDSARNTCDLQTELRADFNLGTNDSLAGYSGNAHLENWYGCASGPDKEAAIAVSLHGSTTSQQAYNHWTTTQHEYGHKYGLVDRYPDPNNIHPNDVMEDQYNWPDFWCVTAPFYDHATILANADRYD